MSAVATCPTCKRACKPLTENPAFPFCSKRCKLADLSNWFNERYVVPDPSQSMGDEDDQDSPKRNLN